MSCEPGALWKDVHFITGEEVAHGIQEEAESLQKASFGQGEFSYIPGSAGLISGGSLPLYAWLQHAC